MGQVFNIPAILARVRQAEAEAIEQVSVAVVAEARRRAPIRKVFKEKPGYRRKFRQLTSSERLLAIKRANAYYGAGTFSARRATAHIRNYARVASQRPGSQNALRRSRTNRTLGTARAGITGPFTPRTDARRVVNRRTGAIGFSSPSLSPLLTSRGKYEVRSGRAIHITAAGKVQIGGALKASIEAEGAVETGNGMEDRVTAGIRYAKFVEFPTIRTHAQPFLLPALHQNREKLVKVMAAEVRKALGG